MKKLIHFLLYNKHEQHVRDIIVGSKRPVEWYTFSHEKLYMIIFFVSIVLILLFK